MMQARRPMTQRDFEWIGTFAREFHPSKSWISVASSRNDKESPPRLESAKPRRPGFRSLDPGAECLDEWLCGVNHSRSLQPTHCQGLKKLYAGGTTASGDNLSGHRTRILKIFYNSTTSQEDHDEIGESNAFHIQTLKVFEVLCFCCQK